MLTNYLPQEGVRFESEAGSCSGPAAACIRGVVNLDLHGRSNEPVPAQCSMSLARHKLSCDTRVFYARIVSKATPYPEGVQRARQESGLPIDLSSEVQPLEQPH